MTENETCQDINTYTEEPIDIGSRDVIETIGAGSDESLIVGVTDGNERVAVGSGNDEAIIVYWTPNGSVWHIDKDCITLKKSKVSLSGSIEESGKSRGCKVCTK